MKETLRRDAQLQNSRRRVAAAGFRVEPFRQSAARFTQVRYGDLDLLRWQFSRLAGATAATLVLRVAPLFGKRLEDFG